MLWYWSVLILYIIISNIGCDEGEVRLVGGSNTNEGRVEICTSGQWGTVCDDDWDKPDATVVCRQLGFSDAGSVSTSSANFGEGIGPISINRVQCNGTETRLANCSSGSVASCTHSRDAGVRCLVRTGMYIHICTSIA